MRWRLLVLEAAAFLLLARILVATTSLRHWRSLLGGLDPVAGDSSGAGPCERELARAVARADYRLPIGCKCLQRAIALYWMLRRRARPAILVIAIIDSRHRGSPDDLHAWTESGGEILIGATELPHHAIARFGRTN
jgi:hypothetical protein